MPEIIIKRSLKVLATMWIKNDDGTIIEVATREPEEKVLELKEAIEEAWRKIPTTTYIDS